MTSSSATPLRVSPAERLILDTQEPIDDGAAVLRFHVVDADGSVVRDLDVSHTQRMHLIVVRHDLRGFQHLHPAQEPDGSWSVPITFWTCGRYRIFGDFTRAGRPAVVWSDLLVGGPGRSEPLPPPAETVVSDTGLDVALAPTRLTTARATELAVSVTGDGRPVHFEPYLGARGHLVALRAEDLSLLHVHPSADAGDGSITFTTSFHSEGAYRLFLQFQAAGRVHTAAFTRVARLI